MPYERHEPASTATSRGPFAPLPQPKPSRALPVLGVVLGLLGLIAGTAAWFRGAPSKPVAPSYSAQEVADARSAVCEAYAKGMKSIRTVASRKAESPADVLPVAVNSRIGESAVAMYFLNTVSGNPAAPTELRNALVALAQQYQEVVLIQLADGAPQDWKANGEAVDAVVTKIDHLCQ